MNALASVWQDLRYTFRGLRKDRTFALLAIFALALGVGATTVIYSVVDGVLLHPFPYRNADRLVNLYIRYADAAPDDYGRSFYTTPQLLELRDQMKVFEDVMGGSPVPDVLYSDGEGTRRFSARMVTANAFEFLGIKPLLGRSITAADANPGSPPIAAISYRMWTKEFNRNPNVLGTSLTFGDERRTVVAVMPPRFVLEDSDVWMPVSLSSGDQRIRDAWWWTLGRRKPGVTLQRVQAQFDVIARRFAKLYPDQYPKQFTTSAVSTVDGVVRDFRTVVYTLAAAVAMLLLIACSNVANLLLARATARQKEIAIRASVGASRGRIIRQLMVESFVLAFAACLLGCAFAYLGLQQIVKVVPPNTIPAESQIVLNRGALVFAVLLTMLTTLLCGLAPALHAVRRDLHTRLQAGSKGASNESRHGRLRSALVVAEVAFSIVLLVGAGLMIRTLFALEHVKLALNPHNVLVVGIPLPEERYKTPQQASLFFERVLQRIETLPGVTAATQSVAPPPLDGFTTDVTIPGKPHSNAWNTMLQLCSDSYFRILEIPLVRGRLLSESDVTGARHVAVVNQALARAYFGKEDAIGQTIKFNELDKNRPFDENRPGLKDLYFEIIGVVADSKNRGLQEPPMPEAFAPFTVVGFTSGDLMVKTTVDPSSMLPLIRREVWSVDPNVPVSDIGSLEDYLQQYAYSRPQFEMVLIAVFAAIGLALVAVGIFSVMAYTVSLRTHEIGVRMALGAERRNILRMVVANGLTLMACGGIVGLALSAALTRLISAQLWGVSAMDPATFAAVFAVLLLVGLAASLAPANRATKVDPLLALRSE